MLDFLNGAAPAEIYTLSLHDALPISSPPQRASRSASRGRAYAVPRREVRALRGPLRRSDRTSRSEEHTSELQSRRDLVCRLLLEKKKQHTDHLKQKKTPQDHPSPTTF